MKSEPLCSSLPLVLVLWLAAGMSVACGNPLREPTPTALPKVAVAATVPHTSTATASPLPATATPLAPTPTVAPRATKSPTRVAQATRTSLPATTAPTRMPPAPLVWDGRLDQLGIRWIPAPVAVGQPYWRLIKAEFWDENQSQYRHHIYMNVLDEGGTRLVGQKLIVEWPDEKLVLVTEDKPAPEFSANFPLDINHYPPWGTLGAFTVWVDGLPSDKAAGMGLPSRNKPVVYWLTFQRAIR